jgi:hypothetical protein
MSLNTRLSTALYCTALIWFTGCVGPMACGHLGSCGSTACNQSCDGCGECEGCGELYIDPWINHRADRCDPCDRCGNHNGQSCGKCRSVFSGVASLWGYRCGDTGGCGNAGCGVACDAAPLCDICGNSGCAGGCGVMPLCDACGNAGCTGGCVVEPGCGACGCGNAGCAGGCVLPPSCGACGNPGCTGGCVVEPGCGCDSSCGGCDTCRVTHPNLTQATRQPTLAESIIRAVLPEDTMKTPRRTRKIFQPRRSSASGPPKSSDY